MGNYHCAHGETSTSCNIFSVILYVLHESHHLMDPCYVKVIRKMVGKTVHLEKKWGRDWYISTISTGILHALASNGNPSMATSKEVPSFTLGNFSPSVWKNVFEMSATRLRDKSQHFFVLLLNKFFGRTFANWILYIYIRC